VKGFIRMKSGVMVSANSRASRCIDGRKAIMFVEWDGQKWVVAKRGNKAAGEYGPQFLGGGLMFVRLLQEVAHLSLEAAFEATESVFRSLGWTPQIHMDDHHGEYDFLKMADEDVIETVMKQYFGGCGFAKFAWSDKANDVLQMALARKWRVQILTGEHKEKGASKNMLANTTFKTPNRGGKTRFNLDFGDAHLAILLLSANNYGVDFHQQAVQWVDERYGQVVVALKGVSSPAEIVELR
jgi:hypothetical protein